MAKSARYRTFEGQFESSVLGTFRIIRGIAKLQGIAVVSGRYGQEFTKSERADHFPQ